MSLLQRVRQDSLAARKARDGARASFLITLLGEIERVGKDAGNRETSDTEALAVIQKFAKNLNEVLTVKPGDAQALFERGLLQAYLPEQLSGSTLAAAIDAIVQNLGLTAPSGKDMGAVMKALSAQHAGAYDGAEASKLVRQRLQAS